MAHNEEYKLNEKTGEIEKTDWNDALYKVLRGETPPLDPDSEFDALQAEDYVTNPSVVSVRHWWCEGLGKRWSNAKKYDEKWSDAKQNLNQKHYERHTSQFELQQRHVELMQFHRQQRAREAEGERVGNIFGAVVIVLMALLIAATYFILKGYGAI